MLQSAAHHRDMIEKAKSIIKNIVTDTTGLTGKGVRLCPLEHL